MGLAFFGVTLRSSFFAAWRFSFGVAGRFSDFSGVLEAGLEAPRVCLGSMLASVKRCGLRQTTKLR